MAEILSFQAARSVGIGLPLLTLCSSMAGVLQAIWQYPVSVPSCTLKSSVLRKVHTPNHLTMDVKARIPNHTPLPHNHEFKFVISWVLAVTCNGLECDERKARFSFKMKLSFQSNTNRKADTSMPLREPESWSWSFGPLALGFVKSISQVYPPQTASPKQSRLKKSLLTYLPPLFLKKALLRALVISVQNWHLPG